MALESLFEAGCFFRVAGGARRARPPEDSAAAGVVSVATGLVASVLVLVVLDSLGLFRILL